MSDHPSMVCAAMENALAFYQIIAWRILYLTMLGRECPELPCNLVFEEQEMAFLAPKPIWIGLRRCQDFVLSVEAHKAISAKTVTIWV